MVQVQANPFRNKTRVGPQTVPWTYLNTGFTVCARARQMRCLLVAQVNEQCITYRIQHVYSDQQALLYTASLQVYPFGRSLETLKCQWNGFHQSGECGSICSCPVYFSITLQALQPLEHEAVTASTNC